MHTDREACLRAVSAKDPRFDGWFFVAVKTTGIYCRPSCPANPLAKNLTFISKADAAGIVLGARVPIILTSRADNVRSRMASCAVAMLLAYSQMAKEPIRA